MRNILLITIAISFFPVSNSEVSAGIEGDLDYTAALASIDADLASEINSLAALRDEIANERIQLSVETEAVSSELREKRRQSQLSSQERDALIHDLSRVKESVGLWRDEADYIMGVLTDFRRNFQAQISLAEAEALRPDLLSSDAGGKSGLEARLRLLDLAVGRLGQMSVPRSLPGGALDSGGIEVQGTFVEVGPVSWFVGGDKRVSGLIARNQALRPEVIRGSADSGSIRMLAEGKEVDLAFDPTLGMGIVMEESSSSLLDHIQKGGFWIYPILIIASVATLAALFKWVQLLRIGSVNPALVREIVEAVTHGEIDAVEAQLAHVRHHPVGKLLRRAVVMGKASTEEIEEALYEEYLKAQPELERGLSLIAIASATAPLLGLLGTVTGMIHTFKLINIFGTGDAKSLSSGISEALVTTEFGLVVAIPSLILHALLSRRVSGIVSATEMAAVAYVNCLKAGQTPDKEPKKYA